MPVREIGRASSLKAKDMAWNKPLEDNKKSQAASKQLFNPSNARSKYVLFALLCISVVTIIYWLIASSKEVLKVESHREESRQYDVNAKSNLTVQSESLSAHKPPLPKKTPTIIALSSLTNSVGTNMTERLDKWGNPRHEARFKSVTEYCLALLFSTPMGKPPPPIPRIPEGELEKMDEILSRPTLVLKDDAESMKQMKHNCDLAKAEFRQFLADGGVDTEFFNYYRNKLMDKYRQWADGQKMVDDAYESGGAERAQETADMVNQLFRAKGLRDVVIPKEEN